MYDRIVSPRVEAARRLWKEALHARWAGWPDVASLREDKARMHLKAARWAKQERIKAGVYGKRLRSA